MISFPVILLRLMVALLIGAFIGLEREIHERSAGMRTLALVSLGSALFTAISAYGFIDIARSLHVSYDPTRIASYVVAGIGFLGGGTIFLSREKEKVQGLTTAAAIWVVAAIGMACGAGFIVGAVGTTALTRLARERWCEVPVVSVASCSPGTGRELRADSVLIPPVF